MTTIAVYNMKGGVGKTTTSITLAHMASTAGRRTLLWDLDPQAAASFALRISPRVADFGKKTLTDGEALIAAIKATDYPNFDLVPADFAYRKFDRLLDGLGQPGPVMVDLLAAVGHEYEFVVLDCPPGFSLLTEGIFAAADAVLVPTIPNVLSLRAIVRIIKRAARSESRALLPVFFNMVDRRKTLHRSACELATRHPDLFLSAQGPYASVVEQMTVRRRPLAAYAGSDAATATFGAVWRELQERLAARHAGTRSAKPDWDATLHTLESALTRLEAEAGEPRAATGLRLVDDSVPFLAHLFDTERRHLARAGVTLTLEERSGAFFVVAAPGHRTGPERVRMQVDASWARDILSETMSPMTALERRLGDSAPALIAHLRSTVGGRTLRRVESVEASVPAPHAPEIRQAG